MIFELETLNLELKTMGRPYSLCREELEDIEQKMVGGKSWKDIYVGYGGKMSWWGFRKLCRRIKKSSFKDNPR